MTDIEPDHPRAESLKVREKISNGLEKGLVTPEGLGAHGRGEAFDYILGENTSKQAKKAISAGASEILLAENPIISVNGNTAALVPEKISELSKKGKMKIEVNLFHKSEERKKRIAEHLKNNGAEKVLGVQEDYLTEIPQIKSERKTVDERGIKKSDVVLVPLEDGDRTEALTNAGKKVIAVDLNPMSRTAKSANVTIVDNIVRTMPKLISEIENMKQVSEEKITGTRDEFDNEENRKKMLKLMLERLEELSKRRLN